MTLQSPTLSWREVVLELDHPEFYLSDMEGLRIVIQAYRAATVVRGGEGRGRVGRGGEGRGWEGRGGEGRGWEGRGGVGRGMHSCDECIVFCLHC